MSKDLKNISGGLKELPQDERDFKLGSIFSIPDISILPDEFTVADPVVNENQLDTDMCTAFVTARSRSREEMTNLDPLFHFMATKEIEGGNFREWGADIRTALKAAVKVGDIPLAISPYKLGPQSRDYIADPSHWGDQYRMSAKGHRAASYFSVTGPYDIFDNIRTALWLNKAERRTVITGLLWRTKWTSLSNGIIPHEATQSPTVPHCIEIVGWKKIGSEHYLIAPLTNGRGIGDAGVFYFPRNIINSALGPYGVFTLKDMDPEEVKKLLARKETKSFSLWEFIKKILHL